ncbi:MAG: RNA polymerase sigma factor [Longimicrobiales bacterium]
MVSRTETSSAFPLTRASIIHATGSDDPRLRQNAWGILFRSYWKPVYKYIRIQWSAPEQDAQDLTQEFFTHAMESGFIERFDPARARFRTYLRTCLQRFLVNRRKAMTRHKRGGEFAFVPLDFASAEDELRLAEPSASADPDEFFRQESIRSLFSLAVEDVRVRCEDAGKHVHFAVFERYDLLPSGAADRPTYQQLATEFRIPVTQVTNNLAFVRREFRRAVLDNLREISGTEAEFREEAISLLGIDPG